MEGDEVELVLSRAAELRLKISNCIHKSALNAIRYSNGNSVLSKKNKSKHNEEQDDAEDAERLLQIRDALESLEQQLSNLQVLQRRQPFEREVALSEIKQSRKMLSDKLKKFKGADLEVIHEASAFVGETVEYSNDLSLPPYQSRPPTSVNKYLNHSISKSSKNASKNSSKGAGSFIFAATKKIITVFGVISVLSLSGFGSNLSKRKLQLNIVDLFRKLASEEKRAIEFECPPGKLLVWEDGEVHCVVKERVAIPFASVVAKPDLDYGCG